MFKNVFKNIPKNVNFKLIENSGEINIFFFSRKNPFILLNQKYQFFLIFIKRQVPGKIAAVDCVKHASLATKYEVNGYPTLKYFKAGKDQHKYRGPRTAEAIVDYMKKYKLVFFFFF